MPILRFQTNVPQQVRLNSLEGRLVDSQFGGSQYLFHAQEGAFYVSDKVGCIIMEQFKKLDVKPGDAVEITKAEDGAGPGRKTRWVVSTDTRSDADEAPSELEVKLAESIRLNEARKQAQRAAVAAPATAQQPEWAQHLIAQTNALVDCYAAVMRHAAQHDNVRGEDVRSIFLSAYINVAKLNGSRNAA